MHTAQTAYETLEYLWHNYLTLLEQVDLETMPPDVLDVHIKENAPVRPFRLCAWLARYGYYIAAWTLWEYYSRSLCDTLPVKEKRRKSESTVDWVARSLATNSIPFADRPWFASANCVRNLIAHGGGRVDGTGAKELFQRSLAAFPQLERWQDGYLDLKHEHLAELQFKIEEFIRNSAERRGTSN